MPPWNSPKAKVQLRLSCQRLRTLQQKQEALAKSSRREIATLLERGKLETAKIKVENIINLDINQELLELLELYCELLIARFGLLDLNSREPDPGVSEGVAAIIHAAPRTELKELHILRDMLMHKFGRDYSAMVVENRDQCVTDRVIRKLVVATPSSELVDAYLWEIAKAYGVNWAPPSAIKLEGTKDDDDTQGGVAASLSSSADDKTGAIIVDKTKDEEPRGAGTPKLPDIPPTEGDEQQTKAGKSSESKAKPASPEDDFDALTRRFAELKKR